MKPLKKTSENIFNRSKKIYSAKEVKEILDKNGVDTAFVLGNGINRYYSKNNLSWEELLLNLWNKYTQNTLQQTQIFKGISFTEFYDAIEIKNIKKDNFSSTIQREVKDRMLLWKPNNDQNKIIDKIRSFNAPILTSNFDDLIPRSSSLDFFKLKDTSFTDYYPWNCYYSYKELRDPLEGFGVWYPNGMIKYQRSIKLGLSQYMGNVERSRKMLHDNKESIYFEGKNKKNWKGYLTWMHILFNKSLFIMGLGLEENEIFFRWLLIERAKYFKLFPRRKKEGWYVTARNNSDTNFLGKKFFLESVGIQVIEVEDYKVLFEDIWES